MNILIAGCGRIGLALTLTLCEKGYDVSVVDKNEEHIETLKNSGFDGAAFCGIPIDDDVLKKAGIDSCDAVCALTDEDNVNIMVAQLAKDIYGISTVVARVLDAEKELIFQELGVNTLCPTNLTVDSIMSVLNETEGEKYLQFGVHTTKFFTIETPDNYVGEKALSIDLEENEILYAIQNTEGVIRLVNNYNVVLEAGDKLIFSKIID